MNCSVKWPEALQPLFLPKLRSHQVRVRSSAEGVLPESLFTEPINCSYDASHSYGDTTSVVPFTVQRERDYSQNYKVGKVISAVTRACLQEAASELGLEETKRNIRFAGL